MSTTKPTAGEIEAAKEELSWLSDLPLYVEMARPYMTHPDQFVRALTTCLRDKSTGAAVFIADRAEETAHAIMVLARST